jgi:hypothetical protein
VLFTKRDFLLQVYYLFSNFVEFTNYEPNAQNLLNAFKRVYEDQGEDDVFQQVAQTYPQILDFKENFDRLHHQAQLPLKLLLFPHIAQIIQQMQLENKEVCILVAGDPMMQLNKIKQIDWGSVKPTMKLYFEDELRFKKFEPLAYILEDLKMEAKDVAYIGHSQFVIEESKRLNLEVFPF